MKGIAKTIKENAGSIITAFVALLLVCYYLFGIIPENKLNQDNHNRLCLREFANQFNITLADFVNQVDVTKFSEEADKQIKAGRKEKDRGNSSKNNSIVIEEIKIKSLLKSDSSHYFLLNRVIKYSLINTANGKKLDTKTIGDDTLKIYKTKLADRLNGASTFGSWLLYPENSSTQNSSEYDSYKVNKDLSGEETNLLIKHFKSTFTDTFNLFNKRYYKRSLTVDGTDFSLTLIGAVSLSAFEQDARMPDVSLTIASLVLLVVLFLIIPLIKPFISSAYEKLTQFDLVSTTASIGVCAIVLSVAVSTYFFSGVEDNRSESILEHLNSNIADSMKKEWKQFYSGYSLVTSGASCGNKVPEDLRLDNPGNYKNSAYKHANRDSLKSLILREPAHSLIKCPKVVFVMDSAGYMIRDIAQSPYALWKRYNEREYFKKIKDSAYNHALSAVFSKYHNRFELVYVEECSGTHKYDTMVRGFSYIPKDYFPDTLDNSYGYFLCNAEGRVLLHKDDSRRLNENVYKLNRHSDALLKMLRGEDQAPFKIRYNGEPTLFCAKKFFVDTSLHKTQAPLYLVTYKKLRFEDQLKIYTVVKGILLSISFAIGVALLLLLYSVFYNYGHISIFSRQHVTWLFPDNSRVNEFKFIKRFNFVCCAVLLLLIKFFPSHTLFITFILAINASFISFVLLVQRVFEFNPYRFRGVQLRYFALMMALLLTGFVISYLLYIYNSEAWALTINIISHLVFLWVLRRDKRRAAMHSNVEANSKYNYNLFLASIMSFHYLLIPSVIIFCITSFEINRRDNYQHSKWVKVKSDTEQFTPKNKPHDVEWLVHAITFPKSPSRDVLSATGYQTFEPVYNLSESFNRVYKAINVGKVIYMFLTFVFIVMCLAMVTRSYSRLFFFFELNALFKNNNGNGLKPLPVVAPYRARDLKKLERQEIGAFLPEGNEYPSRVNNKLISERVKMEMILLHAVDVNRSAYKKLWHSLSTDEKFVLCDFSNDGFINFRNRLHLISLMKKGLVISDTLTGRLRLAKHSFGVFVMEYEGRDAAYQAEIKEKAVKGTFATWKLPLAIVAVSFLLLLMYLYQEQYNQFLLIGGSLISTITMLAKFLNTYKK